MAASHCLLLALLVLQASMLVFSSDPTPLQDFCIANNSSPVFVNGIACKDPKLAKAEDFFFSGLNKPGKPSNPLAPGVVTVQIPGLNTLGISMARLDFGPSVENALHYHPRATEILTVLEGTLHAGFIASDGRLFTKVLNKGDVFVFPQGTIHYQLNRASTNAVALAALSSQNPGVISIPSTVFGSEPSISVDVLAKAFQLDTRTPHPPSSFLPSQPCLKPMPSLNMGYLVFEVLEPISLLE